MIQTCYWKSPVGELIIGSYNGKLCLADWRYRKMRPSIDNRIQNFFQSEYSFQDSELNTACISQLEAYFRGVRTNFDIPLIFAGTDFQISVWTALQRIAYGQTQSYLGLSEKLGNKKAIRAVAGANGANAISIIIPCHRIIGSSGKLTGYAGGLEAKRRLLELEGVALSTQISLF